MDLPPKARRSRRLARQHARRQQAIEIDKEKEERKDAVYDPALAPPEEPDPATLTIEELRKRIRVAVDPTEENFDPAMNGDILGVMGVSNPLYRNLQVALRQASWRGRLDQDTFFALLYRISRLYRTFLNGRLMPEDWLLVESIFTYYKEGYFGLEETQSYKVVEQLFWEGGVQAAHRQAAWGHWRFVNMDVLPQWASEFSEIVYESVTYTNRPSPNPIQLNVDHERVQYVVKHAIPFFVDKVLRVRQGTAIYPSLQERPVLIQIPPLAKIPYDYDVVLSVLFNCRLVLAWAGNDSGKFFMSTIVRELIIRFKKNAHRQAITRIEQYIELNLAWRKTWNPVREFWRIKFRGHQVQQAKLEEIRRRRRQKRGEALNIIRPIQKE